MNKGKFDWFGSKSRIRIIVCLSDGQQKYERQIAKETELSATAISNSLDYLIKEKIVFSKRLGWIKVYWLNRVKTVRKLQSLWKLLND